MMAITGILDSDRIRPFRIEGTKPRFQQRMKNPIVAAKRLLKINVKMERGVSKGQIVNIKA